MWGKRLAKYSSLAALSANRVEWQEPQVFEPYYLLTPIDWTGWESYSQGYQVSDAMSPEADKKQIFKTSNVGLATGRDDITIQFSRFDIEAVVNSVAAKDEAEFRRQFNVEKFSTEWSWKRISKDITENAGSYIHLHYRPFDDRQTYYTGQSNGFMSRPRSDIADHMVENNIGLITSRMTKGETYAHVDVTNLMSEAICLSPTTSNNGFLFPLRLGSGSSRTENFTPIFREFLDGQYGEHYDPEQILGYIYAVLHAPTYRSRYAEFLRIDFPRIPFAETPEQFEALSVLGWDLIQTHLLKTVPRSKPRLGDYVGKGDHTVDGVVYSPDETTIWINPKRTQGFANVPQAVWDFHIGGYQVLDKYLKSRKGRTLNLDEQTHVGNIAESLNFTIAQMALIDAEYLKAFP